MKNKIILLMGLTLVLSSCLNIEENSENNTDPLKIIQNKKETNTINNTEKDNSLKDINIKSGATTSSNTSDTISNDTGDIINNKKTKKVIEKNITENQLENTEEKMLEKIVDNRKIIKKDKKDIKTSELLNDTPSYDDEITNEILKLFE